MREIEFRGKRVDNGNWVYGYYLVAASMPFISTFGEKEPIAVIPETVGQYTGLKDKNGNKIYEGDKVRTLKKFGHFREKGEILEVYWNEKLLQYGLTINSGSYLKHGDCDWLQLTTPKAEYLEVIGNIHEVKE